tara:strand:- start:284 stop:679 length:396 start_codon:yes stop_codon:yes gene_type:complete
MEINIAISCGELIDKLTILSIKLEKIKDENKINNISKEYDSLNEISNSLKNQDNEKFEKFYVSLKKINLELWEIEDEIRKFEKDKTFDNDFIKLARSVYIKNDQRFKIKNDINQHFSSEIKEEKEYQDYSD